MTGNTLAKKKKKIIKKKPAKILKPKKQNKTQRRQWSEKHYTEDKRFINENPTPLNPRVNAGAPEV